MDLDSLRYCLFQWVTLTRFWWWSTNDEWQGRFCYTLVSVIRMMPIKTAHYEYTFSKITVSIKPFYAVDPTLIFMSTLSKLNVNTMYTPLGPIMRRKRSLTVFWNSAEDVEKEYLTDLQAESISYTFVPPCTICWSGSYSHPAL